MSEKPIMENQETNTGETNAGSGISANEIRESKIFQSAVKSSKQKAEQAQAELDQLKLQIAETEDTERKEKLEKSEQYQVLIKEAQGQNEKLKTQLEEVILKHNLTNALRDKGVSHPVLLSHSLNQYSGDSDGISEYVDGILNAEENKIFFTANQEDTGQIAPPVVRSPSARSAEPSLEERLEKGDLAAMNEKLQRMVNQKED